MAGVPSELKHDDLETTENRDSMDSKQAEVDSNLLSSKNNNDTDTIDEIMDSEEEEE